MTPDGAGTMRALRFHARPVHYLVARALGRRAPAALPPLRLEQVARPEARTDWHRVDVRLTGICGSDLALLFGRNSPRLSPFFTFPAVLGHEILGAVEGTRVAVDPVTACRERALEACSACRRGDEHRCDHIADGSLAAGLIGFNRDLPGGWGEEVLAHESRLHEIPDGIPDERAVLAEPFAVAWRAARIALARTEAHAPLLVLGSGTIGLLCIAALRHGGFTGALHVVARYGDQRELARALGADHVHDTTQRASEAAGARAFEAIIGPPAWRGGFGCVIDAAGTASSLDQAAWAAREGGTIVLVGAPGSVRLDASPLWFKELTITGSYVYTRAEFAEAVAHLGSLPALDALAPRRYPLERHRAALADLRARRVRKGAFDPRA